MRRLADLNIPVEATLEELRSMDASCFIKEKDVNNYRYWTNIDGLYVTDPSAAEAIKAGKLKDVSILAGLNMGESDYLKVTSQKEFYQVYRELLGGLYDKYDFENLVKVDDYSANAVSRTLASLGFSTNDARNLMLCRVHGKMAEEELGGDAVNYSYLFTHRTPERMEEVGTGRAAEVQWSWHSSELCYSFDSI